MLLFEFACAMLTRFLPMPILLRLIFNESCGYPVLLIILPVLVESFIILAVVVIVVAVFLGNIM